MGKDFWTDLRGEIQSQSVVNHPLYLDLVAGKLKKNTVAELCAQLKYTVTDGIASLALIVPQAPRDIKKEIAENLFGELAGTPEVPSHWELALRAGMAAGFTADNIDARPMFPETKIYPDTVAAYAMRGAWVEALSFVALGIEDMFTQFCDGATEAVQEHYGFSDDQAAYFSVHIGADEHHAETGWHTARTHGATDEKKQSIRRAALEGRNMWWNMYSAIYSQGEGKNAPTLRLNP
ncbi:MAG: pyrroloquinoline-quinone synthase [Rhodospirillaceae bacterium]|jgi:pyrroloquinoline-quinone synthase|nr:pyrroloquinoline-quinone synthase [Rhodospirillaceae bacterium]